MLTTINVLLRGETAAVTRVGPVVVWWWTRCARAFSHDRKRGVLAALDN
jgi:hypothetical protein